MYKTGAVVAVLSALDDVQWRWPTQLAVQTGLSGPGVSKILHRLEGAGLVESRWEEAEEAVDGAADGQSRQRRHYFRLTPAGLLQALVWAPRNDGVGRG